MSNSMSLHFFLLCFLIICFAASSSSSFLNNTRRCSPKQSLALLHFKQNLFSFNYSYDDQFYESIKSRCKDWLGSSYYPIMMNWNTNVDCCSWDGVTCNYFTGDVIGLDLSCGMLSGTLHPNTTLFHLPHLQRLNLAFNDFNPSKLPHEIGRLANRLTYLNISFCGFEGQVPLEISLLPKLVSLDLHGNDFNIPSEPLFLNNLLQNSTLLRELNLAFVDISSVLPTYLNMTSSLKSLDLSFTQLQGKIPGNIFNLPYLEELLLSYNNDLISSFPNVNMSIGIPLKWLDLSYTNLSGKIPNSIGQLKSLNYLDLYGTKLSGEIPYSIGQLKSLNTFRISECSLIGPIPKSIGNLRHLTHLELSSNMLNGTLPSSLFTISSLQVISLENNNFSGSIPSELVALHSNQLVGPIHQPFRQLIYLNHLDLSYNKFSGVWELNTLLSSLKSLTRLELSYSGLSVVTTSIDRYINPYFYQLGLASCKLTVFPKSIKAMKNLEYLDLSANKIHGHIPNWIGGNQLSYLDLSHNFITGLQQHIGGLYFLFLQSNQIQGPFPPSLCVNMSLLRDLDLSNNSFGGVLPHCFGNISFSLAMADLGNNHFNGTIPNVFEECGNLEGLILNGNEFEGDVPSSLSKCKSLKVVDLGNNHLNGTFPVWLGGLPKLQVLVLNSNKLHGPLECSTTTKLPFPSLKVLDLSYNGFVGHLPENYFQNFRAMKNVVKKGTKPEYVYMGVKPYSIIFPVKGVQLQFEEILVDYTIINLSNNKFEGEIPDAMGSLNSLIVLNLSHNSLRGRIPDALGNLVEIESLDLSWNQLIGHIPQSLAGITTLEVLNLSHNRLMGRIPVGKQFNTFDENSFGGNPELCGFQLPKHCEHRSSPQLDDDEDIDNGFTWKVVVLGFGCGTLLGLGMGYLMLSTGRPKWFNAIADAGENMIQTRRNKRRYVYIGK